MPHWEQAFATTRHDVTAFLSSVSRDLGPESRHIHKGLTSNGCVGHRHRPTAAGRRKNPA